MATQASAEKRSPEPITVRLPACRFTAARKSQLLGPTYFCCTVRPWTVIAATPRAKAPSKIVQNRSALSCESSMPRRILSVTGTSGGSASRTRDTISSAVSGTLSR